MVHYRLFKPYDIRGNPINDSKYRNGDRRLSIDTKKIIKILYYPDQPHYRYVLSSMPHISYSDYDLKPSKNKNKEETFIVKDIIGKEVRKGETFYRVWWKGQKKNQSTWEPVERLIEDGIKDYIQQFEYERRAKNKRK